ncbi:MAG: nitroreductase family protein [Paraglaciecola sp.]|uniref:nitroreductase family protein n=1 Tax=Paraglaciecola sp. TaxID=1920173 RepID=UPI0032990350
MKKILKKVLPSVIFTKVRELMRYQRLKKSFLYDLNHYFKHSMNLSDYEEDKLISRIVLDTHVIEKGLTMPEARLGFGLARLNILMENMRLFIQSYDVANPQLLHGFSVLQEYVDFHEKHNHAIDSQALANYNKLVILKESKDITFTSREQRNISKSDYFLNAESSFFEFSESRSSLRNYSAERVSQETLKQALDLARNTPSACNRQSVRVHLYRDLTEISKILEVQGGNRGFGHLANFLIAVTFKPKIYFEQNERNSGHVDGGMYAMNILYALHCNKLAACILNAAHAPAKDKKMRSVANIPDDEIFVAFIAGGIPPDDFKIARSFRYPLDYVLTEHN